MQNITNTLKIVNTKLNFLVLIFYCKFVKIFTLYYQIYKIENELSIRRHR